MQLAKRSLSQNLTTLNQTLAQIESFQWGPEDGQAIASHTIAYQTFIILSKLAPASVDFFDGPSLSHWIESVYGGAISQVSVDSLVVPNVEAQRTILSWVHSYLPFSANTLPRRSPQALGLIQNLLSHILSWQNGHPAPLGWEITNPQEMARLNSELAGLQISPEDDIALQAFVNEDLPIFLVKTLSRKIYKALLLIAPLDINLGEPSQLSQWIHFLEERHQAKQSAENRQRYNISELRSRIFPILMTLHERLMGHHMKKAPHDLTTPGSLHPFLIRLVELTIQDVTRRSDMTLFINTRLSPSASSYINYNALYEALAVMFPGFEQNPNEGISELQRFLENISASGEATSHELTLFSQNIVPYLTSRLYDLQLNLSQSRQFFLEIIKRMTQASPERRDELLTYLEGLTDADLRDARKGTRPSTLRVLKLTERLMGTHVESFLEGLFGPSFERRHPGFSTEVFTGFIIPQLKREAHQRTMNLSMKNGLRDLLLRLVADAPLSQLEKQGATAQILALNLRENDDTQLMTGLGRVTHSVYEALMILVRARRLSEHTLTTEAGWGVLLGICESDLT